MKPFIFSWAINQCQIKGCPSFEIGCRGGCYIWISSFYIYALSVDDDDNDDDDNDDYDDDDDGGR